MSQWTSGKAFPTPVASQRAFVHRSYVDEVLSYVAGASRY